MATCASTSTDPPPLVEQLAEHLQAGQVLSSTSVSMKHSHAVQTDTSAPVCNRSHTSQVAEADSTVDCSSSVSSNANLQSRRKSKNKTVSVAVVKKSSRRVWDKKLACYFCNKLLKNKISEHMTRVHGDEFDVARILPKPPGSSERKLGWEKLKNLGNFNHNVATLTSRDGELIVKRRGTTQDPGEFIPCEFCYGFFQSHLLWKHVRKCLLKPVDAGDVASSDAVANGRLLLEAANPVATSADVDLKHTVLKSMRSWQVLSRTISF